MTIGLDLQLDARNLRRLRLLAGASRFHAAHALTKTAQAAQPAWRAANKATFHMRREWINRGIRIRAATKANLTAQVGSIDKYMARHVVGGGEDKRSAGRRLFVPNAPAAQQGTHTDIRRQLRSKARTKRKPFVVGQPNAMAMLVRRKGKARGPLEVLGYLRGSVDIPERLDALGIVSEVAQREFPPVFERILMKWAAGDGAPAL